MREIKLGAISIKHEVTRGTAVTPEPYMPIYVNQRQRRVWFRRPLEGFCRWLMNQLDIEEAE